MQDAVLEYSSSHQGVGELKVINPLTLQEDHESIVRSLTVS